VKNNNLTLNCIREKIDTLVGREINMEVCRGRKQIKRFSGVVESAFARVFVVRVREQEGLSPQITYSYSDILCGEVVVELA